MNTETTNSLDALRPLIQRIANQPDEHIRFLAAVGLVQCLPREDEDPAYAIDADSVLNAVFWNEEEIDPVVVMDSDGSTVDIDSQDHWPRFEFLHLLETVAGLEDPAARAAALGAIVRCSVGATDWVPR